MIKYQKQILDNGLTVLVNRDSASKLAAVNILYCVGARNENPARTGFAHLFEHLMFRGTEQFPDFDTVVQMASGENNAFTNNDYTDFYITLPKDNIEVALALEADRMCGLSLTDEKLETEKKVVIEEFKQRYLNQPYGDQNMLLREAAYKVHPYRWSTIGMSIDHIEGATMEEVMAFYHRHYHPANAILSISADIEPDQMFTLAKRWFGNIPAREVSASLIPAEPKQSTARRCEVERDVPATTITIAFHIGERLSDDFFTSDLISDLLAGGDSGRLNQRLVKEQRLFTSVNCYVTGDIDPGLLIFTGQLLDTTTQEQAETALWAEIESLKRDDVDSYELEKVKNKFEANTLFGEINVMNKAMNLGFYQMVGDIELINREVDIYRSIEASRIKEFSTRVLRAELSTTLIYKKS